MSFQLKQTAQVAAYQEAVRRNQREASHEQQKRWDAMRDEMETHHRAVLMERRERRDVRTQRLEAKAIIVQQFLFEVEYLGQDERRARSVTEGGERANRRMLRGTGAGERRNIALRCALRDTAAAEVILRVGLLFEELEAVEELRRKFLLRLEIMEKSTMTNREKWSRLAVQRLVNQRHDFKLRQEAAVSSFHSEERRVRGAVMDDEGFKWLDLLELKRIVLEHHYKLIQNERDRRAREHEECLMLLIHERRLMDMGETDARQNMRTVELMDRAGVRDAAIVHLADCKQRIKVRLEKQHAQWLEVCAGQQIPVMDNETSHRRKIEADECSDNLAVLAHCRQNLDDVTNPLRISVPLDAPVFALTGSPLPILQGFHIEKKTVGNRYSEARIFKVYVSVYITEKDGYYPGDELDLATLEVFSLKEKIKPVFSNLRSMEGVIFDANDAAIGTLERVTSGTELDLDSQKLEETANGRKCSHFKVQCACIEGEALAKVITLLRGITFFTKSPIVCTRTVSLHFKVEFESMDPIIDLSSTTKNTQPLTSMMRRGSKGSFKRSVLRNKSQPAKFDMFDVKAMVVIHVTLPILRVPVGLQIMPYEMKKKIVEGAPRTVTPCFTTVLLNTSDGPHTNFAGGQLKIRIIEGYANADNICFAGTEQITIRKSDVLLGGICVGHLILGKFTNAPGVTSTKDVTVAFDSVPHDMILGEDFIRGFLSSVGFQTISTDRTRRVIEALLLENTKHQPRHSNSTTCKVEISMLSPDELVIVNSNSGPTISMVRTSELTTTKPSCSLLPAATVKSTTKGAIITTGYVSAKIVDNVTDKDMLYLAPGTISVQDAGLLIYAGTKLGTIKYDVLHQELRVDLMPGGFDGLQDLLRSLAFRTTTQVPYPTVKTVQVDVYIPEAGAIKVVKGGPAPVPRRFMQGVCVCPPSVIRDTSLGHIILTHSVSSRVIPAFVSPECEADELQTFFDGGFVVLEFTTGGTQFDLLTIMEGGDANLTMQNTSEGVQISVNGTPVAMCAAPIRGTALKVRFLGKQNKRLYTLSCDPCDLTLPKLIPRTIVREILSRVSYCNIDKAVATHKVLRCQVTDAHGACSEATADVEIIVPNAITRVSIGQASFRYRYGDPKLKTGHVLAAFHDSKMSDDDTEYVKNGYLTVEPLSDATIDDKIAIFSTGVIYTQGTMIFHMDIKIGTWRREYGSGECEALWVDLFPGVSIEQCALLLKHIGFVHSTPHPRKIGNREFLIRFNAGEGADDTRVKVVFDVQPPILWVFPMYQVLNYSEGGGNVSVQHNVYVGLTYGTPLSGSVLEATIRAGSCPEDNLKFVLPRNVKLEFDKIVIDTRSARELLGRIVTPTPGYTGVLVGNLVSTQFSVKIQFDRNSVVTAEFLPLLVPCICYVNTSCTPRTHTRKVVLSLFVSVLNEVSEITTEIEVSSVDDMTEVILPHDALTMVQGFPILFASGAIVEDPDTRTFEAPHSYITAEIVNCPAVCRDEIRFVSTDVVKVDDHTNLVRYRGMIVGALNPSACSGRFVSLGLRDCPIDALSDVMAALQFSVRETITNKITRMLEVNVCGGEKVPPTRARVQVSVHPRMLIGVNDRAPSSVVHTVPLDANGHAKVLPPNAAITTSCMSGGEIIIKLVEVHDVPLNVSVNARSPHRGDKLTMDPAEYFTVVKGVIAIASTGTRICSVSINPNRILISCPRGSKFATGQALSIILQSVAVVSKESEPIPEEESGSPRLLSDASSPRTARKKSRAFGAVARKSIFGSRKSVFGAVDLAMADLRRPSGDGSSSLQDAPIKGPLVVSIVVMTPVSGEMITSTDYVCIK